MVDAVTIMADDRRARTSSGNEAFSIRLKKLEDEAEEAEKARQLQAEQMAQILSAVQSLREPGK